MKLNYTEAANYIRYYLPEKAEWNMKRKTNDFNTQFTKCYEKTNICINVHVPHNKKGNKIQFKKIIKVNNYF